MKKGLIMEGGAMRGMFTAGVMDVLMENKIRFDGGVGVFTGQVPFVWIVNNYSNTGVEQKGLRLTAKSEGGHVVEPAAKFSTTPSPTSHSNTQFMLNAMNEKFRYPQNLKANVAVGYATDDGWSLRAEALYTKTLHNAVFRNLAVENDGEVVYVVKDAPSSALPLYHTATTDYSAVYYLDNTSRGYTYSLSGSVAKEFGWGLSLSVSYIYGRAFAVCDVPSTSSSTAESSAIIPNTPTPSRRWHRRICASSLPTFLPSTAVQSRLFTTSASALTRISARSL